MLWTDVNDIAVELFEKFPDLDPTYILFTDLREMIMNLENFEDDPDRSNEKNSRSYSDVMARRERIDIIH